MLNDQALLRRTSVAHYELHGRIHQSFIIVHTMQTGNQGSPSNRKFQETKKHPRLCTEKDSIRQWITACNSNINTTWPLR